MPLVFNHRHFLLLALAAYLASFASAQDLTPGRVHDHVAVSDDANQSYALYLPEGYVPTRSWPVLFGFCPGGNGRSVVELYGAAAEKFGWIVLGSNNSRNGNYDVCEGAARAMWRDAHARFSIDDERLYSAGMSGGGSVATWCSQALGKPFAGAFVHARGDLTTAPGQTTSTFFLLAPGQRDFNFEESLRFVHRVRTNGCSAVLDVQEGGHGWATADSVMAMLRYAELRSRLPQQAQLDTALRKMLAEEREWLQTKLQEPLALCAWERGQELLALAPAGSATAKLLAKDLTSIGAKFAPRADDEQRAWQTLLTNGLADDALLERYPSVESLQEAERARLALMAEQPGTSAAYAALLCQCNATASLARAVNDLPPDVQAGYRAFAERVLSMPLDFVSDAKALVNKKQPERALVALYSALFLGQLSDNTLRQAPFGALKRTPGFAPLEELVRKQPR